ncbi:nucleoside recognition family protein [Aureimonas flava]|uniref:Nucleoside recognition family protein n=1 Tax=Aureimonas flava TaxID=2320271 RepID=A0A3A1WI51_9HYPH|nr:nucleoside recognition domain-containing protein [Aureimonas flava]RIX99709.1 nucleoside recognition family protein [Aureimonas flava]
MDIVGTVMAAGRAAVELSLFTLLPVMVVMLSIMRLAEAAGILDRLTRLLAPVLRPFGLVGLSVFALLQVSFVSFAAPVATLATMDRRGVSDRHLAATFAMVLAMGQANVAFPMAALGLDVGRFLAVSTLGGLVAATAAFHLFGRGLPVGGPADEVAADHAATTEDGRGVLGIINRAGGEAFRIAVGSIPIMALCLSAVAALRAAGALDALNGLLAPVLDGFGVDARLVTPTLGKALGGGVAALGVLADQTAAGTVDARFVNAAAGWLVHPLDLPGVAVLAAAGPRVARLWGVAALGAATGILVRTMLHAALAGA